MKWFLYAYLAFGVVWTLFYLAGYWDVGPNGFMRRPWNRPKEAARRARALDKAKKKGAKKRVPASLLRARCERPRTRFRPPALGPDRPAFDQRPQNGGQDGAGARLALRDG